MPGDLYIRGKSVGEEEKLNLWVSKQTYIPACRDHCLLLAIWRMLLVMVMGVQLLTASPTPAGTSVVRVGFYENPPKIFSIDADSIAGFWPDLIRQIAADQHWQIQWVPGSWSQGMDRLEHNAIDIMPDVAWSEARAQQFTFSKTVVLVSWSRIYVPVGSKIQTILDLDHRVVGGMRGSINLDGAEGVRAMIRQFNLQTTVREMDDYTAVFQALEDGKLDAGVTNKDFGNAHADLYAIQQTPILLQPVQLHFAYPKHSTLAAALIPRIDRELERLKANKDSLYYQLLEQWLGINPASPAVPRYLIWSLVAVLLGMVLFMIFTVILRHQIARSSQKILDNNKTLRREITQRTKTEAALRRSEEIFRLITDYSMDNIALTTFDLKAKYIFISPSVKPVLGYEPDDLLGRSFWEFIHPDDRLVLLPLLKKYLNRKLNGLLGRGGGAVNETLEFKFKNKSGEWRNMESSVTMAGKHLLAITRDVTERQQLLAASERMQAELHQARKLEALGTMVGGIAHDFNNILQSIFMYAAIVREGIGNDSQLQADFQHIIDDSERARDLIRQILAFSRKSKILLKVQPLQNIIKTALDLERSSLGPRFTIIQNMDQDCGTVLCDQTQIHQIILNLCNNAAQALGAEGGTITVSLQQTRIDFSELEVDRPAVELTIADDGPGMSEEVRQRALDPFYSTKSVGQGTGLGLSVVHGIVEMMQGRLELTSVSGQGTAVHIFLPVIQAPLEEPVRATQVGKGVSWSGHLLFVDDEPAIRQAAERMLTREGYAVTVADDGATALTLLQSGSQIFDLVVSDLSMPILAGNDLAQSIRELGLAMPIILTSGNLAPLEQAKYREQGVDFFMAKPWSPADLLTLVNQIGAGTN